MTEENHKISVRIVDVPLKVGNEYLPKTNRRPNRLRQLAKYIVLLLLISIVIIIVVVVIRPIERVLTSFFCGLRLAVLYYLLIRRAIAQAVSRWLPTAAARVSSPGLVM
jgi:uncharacterized MnhB-related membrane protein